MNLPIGNTVSRGTIVEQDPSGTLFSQQFVPGVTGMSGAGSWDGNGIGGSDPTDDGANPNSTGGWQTTLLSVMATALEAFRVYEQGSPQVATPPVQTPASGIASKPSPGTPLGSTTIFGFKTATVLFAGAFLLVAVALVRAA